MATAATKTRCAHVVPPQDTTLVSVNQVTTDQDFETLVYLVLLDLTRRVQIYASLVLICTTPPNLQRTALKVVLAKLDTNQQRTTGAKF
jgi:hypothetical protein